MAFDLAGAREHRDARVIAPTAGAADGDDGVRAVILQRGFERLTPRVRAALAFDCAGDERHSGLDVRAGRSHARPARAARARHAVDAGGSSTAMSMCRSRSPVMTQQVPGRCRRRPAARLRRHDGASACALALHRPHRAAPRRRYPAGNALADIDAAARRQRRRRVGAGVRGRVRPDRPTVAQGERGRWTRWRDHVGGERPAERRAPVDSRGRTGPH